MLTKLERGALLEFARWFRRETDEVNYAKLWMAIDLLPAYGHCQDGRADIAESLAYSNKSSA